MRLTIKPMFHPSANVKDPLDSVLGNSLVVESLKEEVRRVSALDVPVLLLGQSGTGKELIARAIHELSKRSSGPYVIAHSAAVPSNLFESEFFGYSSGAFTGANRQGRRGRLEMANRGTLFLDEVGDMPLEAQVKLLRVLQDGRFERLGSHDEIYSDFRLVSATHRDLSALVRKEAFRLDLYYRIGVVVLKVPSLSERLEDIPLLVGAFIKEFCLRNGLSPLEVLPDAIEFLQAIAWPGNIRQLKHCVERAVIFAKSTRLTREDFRNINRDEFSVETATPRPETVRQAMEQVEASMIVEALDRYQGNKLKAAAALGISRGYLYKKLSLAEKKLT
jgi:transcriptional regulator with PAS, ATPase and Fis domain